MKPWPLDSSLRCRTPRLSRQVRRRLGYIRAPRSSIRRAGETEGLVLQVPQPGRVWPATLPSPGSSTLKTNAAKPSTATTSEASLTQRSASSASVSCAIAPTEGITLCSRLLQARLTTCAMSTVGVHVSRHQPLQLRCGAWTRICPNRRYSSRCQIGAPSSADPAMLVLLNRDAKISLCLVFSAEY